MATLRELQGDEGVNLFFDSPGERSLAGDTLRTLGAGALGLGGSLAGAAEYAIGRDSGFTDLREGFNAAAQSQIEQTSPEMQRALGRTWSLSPEEGEESIWSSGASGFIGSLAAQGLQAVPSFAASLLPAGLVARGLQAAGAGARVVGAGAAATSGTINAAMSAGSVWNAIKEEVDKASDAELQEHSPAYRDLRATLDEKEARDRWAREASGFIPAIVGAVSGVAGGVFEGRLAMGLASGALRGAGRGFIQGALNEGREEGIQSLAEDIGGQGGQNTATGRPVNPGQIAGSLIQGATLGAAMGGPVGALGGAANSFRSDSNPAPRIPGLDPSVAQAARDEQKPAPQGPDAPTPVRIDPAIRTAAAAAANPTGLNAPQPGLPPALQQNPVTPAAAPPISQPTSQPGEAPVNGAPAPVAGSVSPQMPAPPAAAPGVTTNVPVPPTPAAPAPAAAPTPAGGPGAPSAVGPVVASGDAPGVAGDAGNLPVAPAVAPAPAAITEKAQARLQQGVQAARQNLVVDAKRQMQGEGVDAPSLAEIQEVVDAILAEVESDLRQNIDTERASVSKVLTLVQERARGEVLSRLRAQASQKAQAREGALATTPQSEAAKATRASAELIKAALDGSLDARQKLVDLLLRLSSDKRAGMARRIQAQAQETGRALPDWAKQAADMAFAGKGKVTLPDGTTITRAEAWRRWEQQTREQTEAEISKARAEQAANLQAREAQVERSFREAAPATTRESFDDFQAQLNRMRESVEGVDTEGAAKDSPAGAVKHFLQMARNANRENYRDFMATEAIMRQGDYAGAVALMSETAAIEASSRGTQGEETGREAADPTVDESRDEVVDEAAEERVADEEASARTERVVDEARGLVPVDVVEPDTRQRSETSEAEGRVVAGVYTAADEGPVRDGPRRTVVIEQKTKRGRELLGKAPVKALGPKRISLANAALQALERGTGATKALGRDFNDIFFDAIRGRDPVAIVFSDDDGLTTRVFTGRADNTGKRSRARHHLPREVADDMVESRASPMERVLFKRLQETASDVPIVVFSDADWSRIERESGQKVAGIFTRVLDEDQIARGELPGLIGIPESLLTNPNTPYNGVSDLRETLMHELVHAATVMSISANTQARAEVETLRAHVEDWLRENKPALLRDPDMAYALTDPDEFAAMAFTNRSVQAALREVPVYEEQKRQLGITGRFQHALDAFVRWVQRALNLPTGTISALEAAITLVDRSLQTRYDAQEAALDGTTFEGAATLPNARLQQAMAGVSAFAAERGTRLSESVKNNKLGWITMRQLEQMYSGLFTPDKRLAAITGKPAVNPLQQVVRANNTRSQIAQDFLRDTLPTFKALDLPPEQVQRVSELLLDATIYEVHPDVALGHDKNKHVDTDTAQGKQQEAQHARLAAAYRAMGKEEQAAYHRVVAMTEEVHGRIAADLMQDVLQRWWNARVDANARDGATMPKLQRDQLEATAKRMLAAKKLTDADRDLLGEEWLELVRQVRARAKLSGPYVPLHRHGDYVARWQEDHPKTQRFASESEAQAAAASSRLTVVGEREVYLDAQGNEITQPNAQRLKALVDAELKALPPNPDAEELDKAKRRGFRKALAEARQGAKVEVELTYQTQGMAFFESLSEANAFRADLVRQGKKEVAEIDLRADAQRRPGGLMDDDLARLVEKVRKDSGLSGAEADRFVSTFSDAMLRLSPNKTLESALLRRRKVLGASQDVRRSLGNYVTAASNYHAATQVGLELTDGMRALREQTNAGARVDGAEDSGDTLTRRRLLRELEDRIGTASLDVNGRGSSNPILQKLQQTTQLYFLASPSYSLVQMTQPYLLSAPILAARYGAGKGLAGLARAMNDVGMGRILKGGVEDTLRNLKALTTGKDADDPNLLTLVKKNLAGQKDGAELAAMLDSLEREGLVDANAGIELIQSFRSNRSWAGNKFEQLNATARAMPGAIEVLNRAGTAVAAYRLAKAAGRTEEQAIAAAREVVDMSQGDYSGANSARFMNGTRYPLLAPLMTFRKYAQAIYFLLARQAYLAVKGESKEVRREAFRTLGYTLLAHMSMAGALGLPTEPISVVLGAASMLFGAGEPWDWEREVRQVAADVMGPEAAEVLMRGLPRLVGADLSGRVGLNSLLFMKDVQDYKASTLMGYAGEMLLGAPGGMVMTALQAPGQIANGDYAKAAESVLPKGFRDLIKAGRIATDGLTDRRGERIDNGKGPGVWGTVQQALGFTPARTQEIYEQRRAIKDAEASQTEARSGLMRQWRQAKPSQRGAIWAEIQRWNNRLPAEARKERITFSDLQKGEQEVRRRQRQGRGGTYLPKGREYLRREGEFANVD